MFWLEKNLILSNVFITGESNFDEKNVEEVFNLCSTEQSCINIEITDYLLQNWYFSSNPLGRDTGIYECVARRVPKINKM